MKIRQHLPAFYEGFDKAETEVENWLEIIALPWIERIVTLPGFYRWALHRHYAGETHLLLAEFKAGKKWYVIAYIQADEERLYRLRILPEWVKPD